MPADRIAGTTIIIITVPGVAAVPMVLVVMLAMIVPLQRWRQFLRLCLASAPAGAEARWQQQ